jgi:colanic acid biosynthesis glycosyl transferase WcaI
LRNVRFLPFQEEAQLPLLRAASDVGVSLYRRGSASSSMPSKVYEIMASGRPLLASADPGSDVWRLVEDTGCGLCVEPHDPKRLAGAIQELHRDTELRADMGRRGRAAAEQSFSLDAVVGRYDELLRHVVAGTERAAR